MRHVGQPFNPFRLFNGIFIPEALVRFPEISPGAKLCYGRLTRFAGVKGRCYPSQDTLAAELGVSARNVHRYLDELQSSGLIRTVHRGLQLSNEYEFLWHEVFDGTERTDSSGQGRTEASSPDRQYSSAPDRTQRSSIERESLKENQFKGAAVVAGEEGDLLPLFGEIENSGGRWTKTLAAMRRHSIDAGIELLHRILEDLTGFGIIADAVLARAIAIAYESRTDKLAQNPALLIKIVPNVIASLQERGVPTDRATEALEAFPNCTKARKRMRA